jgi:hypothetical protein
MSAHNEQHEQHEPNNLQPESSGINPRPILTFLIILTVATIFVFILIKGLLAAFNRIDAESKAQPATQVALPQGQTKLPPEPRLQGAPEPDPDNKQTGRKPSMLPLTEMEEYRKDVNGKAESYGWQNKEAGVAHLPIDRAKDLIVERGLPQLSGNIAQEILKAEATRKRVLDAESSAGRIIKQ